jgi:hypothetical protein
VRGLESCSDPIHKDYTNLLCKFEFINSVEVHRENTCWKGLSFDSVGPERILGQPGGSSSHTRLRVEANSRGVSLSVYPEVNSH